MKLTDLKIRKALPTPDKNLKLSDEGGLYLDIAPSGCKSWRLRVRKTSGDTAITLGRYPDMSLTAAREARDRHRRGAAGRPAEQAAPSPTFEMVAKEWHSTRSPRWKPGHAAAVFASFKREVFPAIGTIPIAEIRAAQIKLILQGIEARGTYDHAHDIRQRINNVFLYAEASEYRQGNPAAAMTKILMPLPPARQRPAVVTIEEARQVIASCETIPAFPWTRVALRLLALTAVRPGELRQARWCELYDLDGANPTWRIPADRMKMKREHWVPLSRQAVDALNTIKQVTGQFQYCFPANAGGLYPMSENAIGYLTNRAGWEGRHVPHGWRATFSTIMNERRRPDRDIIDLMLAHVPKDKVEAAYNRAMHWEVRRDIAQEWADLLMAHRPPAIELLALPKRSAPRLAQQSSGHGQK